MTARRPGAPLDLARQRLEKLGQIGDKPQIGPYRRLVHLGGVDIDLDLEGVGCERVPVVPGLTDVEARAQDQKGVGALHGEVAGPVTDRPRAAAPAGGRRWDSRSCVQAVVTGILQTSDDRAEAVGRTGEPHTAAGQDHGTLGDLQPIEHGPVPSAATSAAAVAGTRLPAS